MVFIIGSFRKATLMNKTTWSTTILGRCNTRMISTSSSSSNRPKTQPRKKKKKKKKKKKTKTK